MGLGLIQVGFTVGVKVRVGDTVRVKVGVDSNAGFTIGIRVRVRVDSIRFQGCIICLP